MELTSLLIKNISIDNNYYRPTEVDLLFGDASKAKLAKLDPKHELESLVKEMVNADYNLFLKNLKSNGFSKNSKIYVAGHNGMVGSAIVRKLKSLGHNNLVLKFQRITQEIPKM